MLQSALAANAARCGADTECGTSACVPELTAASVPVSLCVSELWQRVLVLQGSSVYCE